MESSSLLMTEGNPAPIPPDSAGVENYALGAEISTGGMGSVLEARDGKLDRTVAIKVMLLEGDSSPSMRERFLREAHVLAMLAHPNIVPIHDLVWEDGRPLFYSMKRVNGRSLGEILKDLRKEDPEALRDFPLERLLLIFRKVCDAVAFAHSKGVLHRDLKPDNIMVGEFGEVMVMDWGLAKVLDESADTYGASESDSALLPESREGGQGCPRSFSATLHGAVLGTPQYMSPEQASGSIDDVDERSDIYALGGILYAILTLRPPVEGETALEVLEKVHRGEISAPTAFQTRSGSRGKAFAKDGMMDAKRIRPLPHLRGGQVPSALSSVAMKALEREKDRRYPAVTALEADVDAYMSGFATSSQQAGAGKLLWLLLFRHPTFSASITVLLLTSLSFLWKVVSSEQAAQASAEESGRSLANAQLLLANAAFEKGNSPAMTEALDSIPESLRDKRWAYFSSRRDSSLGPLRIDGFWQEVEDIAPVPHQPGQFAIACRNGKIGIVDVLSRKLLRTFDTGDAGDIRIAVSGDGTRLLSRTGIVARCHLFDLVTGEKTITLKLGYYRFKPYPVFNHILALNEDGTLAAFTYEALKEIHLVDLGKGTRSWTRIGHARQMLFHPDGERLIVARGDIPAVEFLDVRDGTLMPGFASKTREINAQALSLDNEGKWLAASLVNGELVLIGMEGRGQVYRKLSSSPISQIAFTPASNVLAISGGNESKMDRALALFEPFRRNQMGTFLGLKDYSGHLPLRIHPDSGHLLTIQSPPQLWHFPDKPLARLVQPGEIGWSCDFLSDSVLLAREGNGLDLYDVSDPEAPEAKGTPLTPSHGITAVHWDSGLIATAVPFGRTTTFEGDTVKLMQFTPDGLVEKWAVPAIGTRDVTLDLRFDAGAERLVRVRHGGEVQVLSAGTGETLATFPATAESFAYRAAFAGTRGCVVTIEGKGRVRLIDPSTGESRASLETPFGLLALAVSPDLRYVAVAGNHYSVLILDADTLEEKHRFFAHDDWISALSFHPTKPLLATGSADHSVKIWDFATGSVRQTFLGLEGSPMHLAFSPNGRLLAVDGMEYALNILGVDDDAE